VNLTTYRLLLWLDMAEDAGIATATLRLPISLRRLRYGHGNGHGYGNGHGHGDGDGDGHGDGNGHGYGYGYGHGHGDGDGDGNGNGYGYGYGYGYGDGSGTQEVGEVNGELVILKLQGGNDRVGYVYGDSANPLFLRISMAHVIRNWGTDSGLGQLAREGPRPNTKLDVLPPDTLVGVFAVIEVIRCDKAAWLHKGFPAEEAGL
jgi:hypothetical protein